MTAPSLSEDDRRTLEKFLGFPVGKIDGNTLLAAFTELQKRGWWEEFYNKFAFRLYQKEFKGNTKMIMSDACYAKWLFRPERIGLICQFVRGKNETPKENDN